MKPKNYTAPITFLCLGALLFFSFFYNLGYRPVFLWDESRRAVDALQLYFEDRWIISYYDNNPETPSTKSPLLLWLQVGSFHLFGLNEWAIRFPAALAASGTGLLCWAFGRNYFKSWWIGMLSGAVFAASYAWVFNHAGRSGDYDALLTLFSTSACLCFFLYCTSGHRKWLQAFWVLFTLAVFTKGVVPFFFVPGLALFALYTGMVVALFKNRWLYLGALFFLLFMGSYYAVRLYLTPEFLHNMNLNELGGRFLSALEDNNRPFYHYLANMAKWRYEYWLGFLLIALSLGLSSRQQHIRQYTVFGLFTTASFLLIISLSKTKLFWYDLPVYPFFSIQIGVLLFTAWQNLQLLLLQRQPKWAQSAIAFGLLAICFTTPLKRIYIHNKGSRESWPWDVDHEIRQQGKFLQQAIRTNKNLDGYVFYYKGHNTHLNFYIKILQARNMQVKLARDTSELLQGRYLVINQPELLETLAGKYALEPETTEAGCSVFKMANPNENNATQAAEKSEAIMTAFP